MALREELERQGNWLFRWRSYPPLVILSLSLIALWSSTSPEKAAQGAPNNLYAISCILISFLGLAVRCLTVGHVPIGTSGRNTKQQEAVTLNTTGVYSITRHPLYLGNFVIYFGVTLFVQVWWFSLLAILAFWLYYERIIFAEEEFLRTRFGDRFVDWAAKTPAVFPRPKNWQPPALPFALKHVLEREYSAFFGIVASFTFLRAAISMIGEGGLIVHSAWLWFFCLGFIAYAVMRFLKKRTRILEVEGR